MLTRVLLGRRLASREQADTKIGVVAGVPALGLDGLASSAYGPEALLTVLIPLFAVGAFGAFTLDRAGLVVHWRRALKHADGGGGRATAGSAPAAGPPATDTKITKEVDGTTAAGGGKDPAAGDADPARLGRRGIKVRLAVNAVGATATGLPLAVILVAKFADGAWITVLAVPSILLVFRAVRRHYARAARRIRPLGPIDLSDTRPPIVVVPTAGWNRMTDNAIRFALRLSPDVISIHLADLDGDTSDDAERHLRHQWAKDVEAPARAAGLTPPRLELIESPYRTFRGPLLRYVADLTAAHPDRLVTVVVPELVKRRWWQFLLHNYKAERLRTTLLRRGDPRLVVVSVPWYLDPPPPVGTDGPDHATGTEVG